MVDVTRYYCGGPLLSTCPHVRSVDYDVAIHANKVQAEEIKALRIALADRAEERDDSNRNLTAALKREQSLQARLADTEAQLERESALLTEAKRQNADLMAIIDKRDEALGFIPLDKGMDMQDELREVKARLAEQDFEYNRKTNALIERHAGQIEGLLARLAEVERDAARYRWLRDSSVNDVDAALFDKAPSEWDASIDAFMRLADSASLNQESKE